MGSADIGQRGILDYCRTQYVEAKASIYRKPTAVTHLANEEGSGTPR